MIVEALLKILEQSVVAGGFLLLLYYFINEQKAILKEFAKELKSSNKTQAETLKFMMQINARLEVLEKKEEIK